MVNYYFVVNLLKTAIFEKFVINWYFPSQWEGDYNNAITIKSSTQAKQIALCKGGYACE